MLRLVTDNVYCHAKYVTANLSYPVALNGKHRPYSSQASDPDFMHTSVLPTDHFQKSLPRLPIPKLEDTCRRYLKSQSVLLKPDEYANTEKIVNAFKDGEGKVLNEELIKTDKQNKHTNYVSDAWFDMYLRDRRAICLNQNPFMAFLDDPKVDYNSQLIRATNFLISSARMMKTLRANILQPEVFHLNPAKSDNAQFRKVIKMFPKSIAFYGAALLYKAYALDMSQYHRLFNTSRIPRPEKDELVNDPSGKHVAVLRNGNLYTFDLLNTEGGIISPAEVMAHVQYILSDNSPPAEFPLAVLTSQHRDTWSKLRQDLVDAGNEDTLQHLDSAMFLLALDSEGLTDHASVSRSFLHGDGSNRWFDKSFSVCMAADGKTAVNFEHSWGDGVAVLRYFNEVFKETTEKPHVHPDTKPANVDSSQAVRKLVFQLPDSVKQGVKDALANFNETVSGLGMDFMKHEQYTKRDIKKFKLSPDSFLQLAIQLGYYRQFGETVATYESCSTAAFKHGRTETIRSATPATKKVCEMFEKSGGTLPSISELQQGLEECSEMHGQLTKEAAMGQGFDRHLLGLRNVLTLKGDPLPAIYQDPPYARINHNILSTSTLNSPGILIGGFAPVVPDGFGVGYGVEDAYLGCNVTSYPRSPPHRDVTAFVQAVEQSIIDLAGVMEGKSHK